MDYLYPGTFSEGRRVVHSKYEAHYYFEPETSTSTYHILLYVGLGAGVLIFLLIAIKLIHVTCFKRHDEDECPCARCREKRRGRSEPSPRSIEEASTPLTRGHFLRIDTWTQTAAGNIYSDLGSLSGKKVLRSDDGIGFQKIEFETEVLQTKSNRLTKERNSPEYVSCEVYAPPVKTTRVSA